MSQTSGTQPATRSAIRRQQRIEDRREQILSAASAVFAEKGYQRATTREIADKADVSEGLIYSYFESKDHLLLAILEKLSNSGFDELIYEDSAKTINQDVLRKTLQIRHGFLDEMDPMMRATMGEAITNNHFREHYVDVLVKPALEAMEKEIENWIENGEIRKTEIPAASRFLLAEIIGLFFLRAINEPYVMEKWQDKEFLQQISDYFVDGLKPIE
ncbi:MAG TPA: TetR/AcrR family transcriptional regulator [Leptolinea sp.]